MLSNFRWTSKFPVADIAYPLMAISFLAFEQVLRVQERFVAPEMAIADWAN
jgi:hypothetical protein